MKINELNPWKTMTAVLSVFVIIIIIGLLTMSKPLISYKLDMNQSISELNNSNAVFTPAQLDDFLKNKSANVVLFDIRDNFVFGQGHIPGAENMSANDLSKKENIERLNELNKKGTTVVLYGEDQLQVNGPWMLFRQAGFENVKILLGGYIYYIENKESLGVVKENAGYLKELQRYDYASSAAPKEIPVQVAGGEKKQVTVTKREKTSAAKGGC